MVSVVSLAVLVLEESSSSPPEPACEPNIHGGQNGHPESQKMRPRVSKARLVLTLSGSTKRELNLQGKPHPSHPGRLVGPGGFADVHAIGLEFTTGSVVEGTVVG